MMYSEILQNGINNLYYCFPQKAIYYNFALYKKQ